MKFTENTGLVLEICKVMNLTVWKFITSMAGVLSSQLLPQMQVELEDYMQACIVRAPFLAALKSGTVDDATARVSVMGAVTAEWRVNRRVRQLTAKLQREIMKRQVEEQHVPTCSAAWIYQDFPALLSEAKAESFSISVLCDLILTRYDLTKDKKFRDLLHYTQSYLQSQNDQLNKQTQKVSQANQYPSHVATNQRTQNISKTNNYPSHVPTNNSAQHTSTNRYSYHSGHMQSDSSRRNTSVNSYTRPSAKTTGYSRACHEPREQEEVPQFGHHHYTTTSTAGSSDSRQYVRPQIQANKQTYNTQGRLPKPYKRADPKPKTTTQKKSFDQKLDDYLAKHCPQTKQARSAVTKSKSPEFSSSHMGGLVIRIAKKPKSVQVTESEKQLTMKVRKRQAFFEHAARIQYALTGNIKDEVQTDKPHVGNAQCSSTKRNTAGAALTVNPRKRKAPDSSHSTSKQNKCARLDTNSTRSATTDILCKRKIPRRSPKTSIQNKCERKDTNSAHSAVREIPGKRKTPERSQRPSIQNKCERKDTNSAHSAVREIPGKRKTPERSQRPSIQNKCERKDTNSTRSAVREIPGKRKTPERSQRPSVQKKCERKDTNSTRSAVREIPGKRKTPERSQRPSVQNKCERKDTNSAGSTKSIYSRKRKAPDSSQCIRKQTKCARLDTGSSVKAFDCHVVRWKY